MAYTPGPWAYDPDRNAIVSTTARGPQWDEDEPGTPISVISTYSACGGDDVPADIALMVASPDLVEALTDLLACVDDVARTSGWPNNAPRHKARAAIAKAIGGKG